MRSNGTQGVTIVEVLVAMLVLGVAMGSLMGGLLANTSVNSRVSHKADAVRISEEKLESYRQGSSYVGLSTTAPITETVSRNGVNYTVITTFCPSDMPSSMVCSNTAVYIRVEVKDAVRSLQKVDTYYTTFGQEQ